MQPTNPANSQQALAELQGFQKTTQNPNQILQQQEQQLGVQGARDTVTGLRGAIANTTNLLKKVAPSVMGRTAGSLVTQAQATRQIGNEQAPIAQNLTEQGTEYNEAGRRLGELEGRAAQSAAGQYQGQQDRMSYLQNLYNTLYGKEESDRNFAEQQRQFNEQQAAQRRAQAQSDATSRAVADYYKKLTTTPDTPTPTPTAPAANNQQASYDKLRKSVTSILDGLKTNPNQYMPALTNIAMGAKSGNANAKTSLNIINQLLAEDNSYTRGLPRNIRNSLLDSLSKAARSQPAVANMGSLSF